jgi:hypothetical protein
MEIRGGNLFPKFKQSGFAIVSNDTFNKKVLFVTTVFSAWKPSYEGEWVAVWKINIKNNL